MITYPIYKVKANYQVVLGDPNETRFTINVGDIGTFQARPDYTTAITPNNPTPIFIDAKFRGQTFTFKPKVPMVNGDILPMLTQPTNTGTPLFTFLPIVTTQSIKNNKFSNMDSSSVVPTPEVSNNSIDTGGHEINKMQAAATIISTGVILGVVSKFAFKSTIPMAIGVGLLGLGIGFVIDVKLQKK